MLLLIIQPIGQRNLVGIQGFGPAAQPPPRSGSFEPCLCPFPDEVPLEFRQGAEDLEDEPPPAGCRIDCLLEALKADALLLEVSDEVDEVAKGPTQPIQAPDDQRIALADIGECLSQAWPFRGGTACRVAEDCDTACLDFPPKCGGV